jgi:hypothetical protein
MNRRSPLDDFLRRKLYHLETGSPMHVWDRINQLRNDRIPVRSPHYVLMAATILALFIIESKPEIFFPPSPPTPPTKVHVHLQNQEPMALTVKQKHTLGLTDLPLTTTPSFNFQLSSPNTVIQQYTPTQLSPIPSIALASNPDRPVVDISRCASFKNLGFKFSYAITSGPELAMRSLYSKSSEPDAIAYAQKRANSEQQQIGLAVSALFTAHTGKGISLSTGFHFAEIREKLPIRSVLEERFTVINIFGPSGEITGVDTLYETIENEELIINKYQTLSVPLIAGIEFPLKRWTITPQAGILFNVHFRQQGSIYAAHNSQELLNFNTAEAEQIPLFNKNLGIGYYSGININFKITPQLSLQAEPYLRAFPSPMSSPEYPIRQQYTQAGFALGLRYHL